MILLTKRANEELDAMGLSDLTVLRNDKSTLHLVGRECGKPIVAFSSMPIGKKLTVTERAIMMNDYVLPVITKYKKELVSLVALMKDNKVESLVEGVKKDLFDKHGIVVTVVSSFSYTEQRAIITSYSASINDSEGFEKSSIKYSTVAGEYVFNIKSVQSNTVDVTRSMNKATSIASTLANALSMWRDANEALATKSEEIERLQEEIKTKCSL